MKELAILGGKPAVDIPLPHYIWPEITDEIKKSVLDQLETSISIYDRSGIILELEEKIKKYFKVKYALLTNSGTTALYSMYVGAGLGPGDEVICPAYTFFATVTPLFFTGAVPILVDCDENGNICPDKIEEKITDKTKAIVVTHMWGIPCEMKKIRKVAKEYGLYLFEDGSHAHGAEYNNKKMGAFGSASAFSMQAQKLLVAGEGGFLLTNDEEIYYRALLLGHYNKRCKQEIPKDYELYKYATTGMGLKFRIHPLGATIAKIYLEKLDKLIHKKNRIAKRIIKELSGFECFKFPKIKGNIKPSWYALVFNYISENLNGVPIEKIYKALKAEGCYELDRPGSTCPLNYHYLFQNPKKLFPNYSKKIKYKKGDFPVAELFHETALKLPVWHYETEIIDHYIYAFGKVIKNHRWLI